MIGYSIHQNCTKQRLLIHNRSLKVVWSEESFMELAVTDGFMGVRRAALEYNVPKSMLSDRLVE